MVKSTRLDYSCVFMQHRHCRRFSHACNQTLNDDFLPLCSLNHHKLAISRLWVLFALSCSQFIHVAPKKVHKSSDFERHERKISQTKIFPFERFPRTFFAIFHRNVVLLRQQGTPILLGFGRRKGEKAKKEYEETFRKILASLRWEYSECLFASAPTHFPPSRLYFWQLSLSPLISFGGFKLIWRKRKKYFLEIILGWLGQWWSGEMRSFIELLGSARR